MAVSFKVPKSPNKDIFDIDTFLGVDLTNSGADMDERRSPNAENMVRYVPGKVRKRTGYKTDVLFGTNTNVNFAAGTSSDEKEVELVPYEAVELYKTINTIIVTGSLTLYLEFDYKAERNFDLKFYSNYSLSIPASEEWTHYSGSINIYTNVKIDNISVVSSSSQKIFIKSFSLLKAKDSSYEWKAAPNCFVERAKNDPVYGCHIAKTTKYKEGNRVVNVNRALNTSDQETSFALSTSWETIYNLADDVFNGAKLYVEFDYNNTPVEILPGDDRFQLQVCGYTDSSMAPIYVGVWRHASYVIDVNSASDRTIKAKDLGNLTNLKIKNFSVMYAEDANYEWSAAPEDSGGTFPIEELFSDGTKNYSLVNAIDET